MGEFCAQASGSIKEADYIIAHYNRSRYENAAEEMDRLLGIKHTDFRSICCRQGKYREV